MTMSEITPLRMFCVGPLLDRYLLSPYTFSSEAFFLNSSFIGTRTIFRKITISTKCTIGAIYLTAQQYFKITIYQPTTYFAPTIVQNS